MVNRVVGLRRWATSLLVLGLAGCGTEFLHPLSDDATSTLDVRLIGRWYASADEQPTVQGQKVPAHRLGNALLVGGMKGKRSTLEAVWLEFDEEKHVLVQRLPFFTTAVGGRRYMSFRANEVEKAAMGESEVFSSKGAYWIVAYELAEKGQVLRIFTPHDAPFLAAVKQGKLAGKITEDYILDVTRVTAKPAQLRMWLANNAKAAFDWKKPLIFRRRSLPKKG